MRKFLLVLGFFCMLAAYAFGGLFVPNEPAFGVIGLGVILLLFFGLMLLVLSFHPKFYKPS